MLNKPDPAKQMRFRLPVRCFIQSIEKIETPQERFGTLRWILARSLYRFRRFDLAQVPAKNRAQALRLELAQWTPFANSAYYVGWQGPQALVWGWDADKVQQAIVAQGLKPQRAQILPESVLQTPLTEGLCLRRCHQGYEGQVWRAAQLEHSRWWPQSPSSEEWLMFQRDAGIAPGEQQSEPPEARGMALNRRPWISQAGSSGGQAMSPERPILGLLSLFLLAPTCWYGFSLYKVQQGTAQLHALQLTLKRQADPIARARSQAQDALARTNALLALDPYPDQTALLAAITRVLPQDKSTIKEWDFQSGQLKITITPINDSSTAFLVNALQQAGTFRDVKALPGRDPKSVTFQMEVKAR